MQCCALFWQDTKYVFTFLTISWCDPNLREISKAFYKEHLALDERFLTANKTTINIQFAWVVQVQLKLIKFWEKQSNTFHIINRWLLWGRRLFSNFFAFPLCGTTFLTVKLKDLRLKEVTPTHGRSSNSHSLTVRLIVWGLISLTGRCIRQRDEIFHFLRTDIVDPDYFI